MCKVRKVNCKRFVRCRVQEDLNIDLFKDKPYDKLHCVTGCSVHTPDIQTVFNSLCSYYDKPNDLAKPHI